MQIGKQTHPQPDDLAQLPDPQSPGYIATGSAGPTRPVKLLARTALNPRGHGRMIEVIKALAARAPRSSRSWTPRK